MVETKLCEVALLLQVGAPLFRDPKDVEVLNELHRYGEGMLKMLDGVFSLYFMQS